MSGRLKKYVTAAHLGSTVSCSPLKLDSKEFGAEPLKKTVNNFVEVEQLRYEKALD
jgi:hypothetical protein